MTKQLTPEHAREVLKDYIDTFGFNPIQIKQLKEMGKKLNKNITSYDGDFSKLSLTPTRGSND